MGRGCGLSGLHAAKMLNTVLECCSKKVVQRIKPVKIHSLKSLLMVNVLPTTFCPYASDGTSASAGSVASVSSCFVSDSKDQRSRRDIERTT